MINALNPNVHLVMELVHHANLPYLAPLVPLTAAGIRNQNMMAPAFISGEVFVASMVDYLMMQSYSNQGTDALILSLLQEWHRQPAAEAPPPAAAVVHPASRCPEQLGSSSGNTNDAGVGLLQQLGSYSLRDLYTTGCGESSVAAAAARYCDDNDDGCDDGRSIGVDQASASDQPHLIISSSAPAAAAAAIVAAVRASGPVDEAVLEEAQPHPSPALSPGAAAAAGAGPARASLGKGSTTYYKRCPRSSVEESINSGSSSSSSSTGPSAATLMQVAVRGHEVGLMYHEYFQQQLQQGVLVLGLYRLVRQQDHFFFCVMTNPLKVRWFGSRYYHYDCGCSSALFEMSGSAKDIIISLVVESGSNSTWSTLYITVCSNHSLQIK